MMKTEILGGGSIKNKAWVEEVQKQLGQEFGPGVIYWSTWDKELDFGIDIEREVEKVVVMQNENDNHGKFEDARAFVGGINPQIQVVKMTGPESTTHNYSYYQEFKEFLMRI